MPTIYTADEVIASFRRDGMVPNAGTTGSRTEDMLAHVNEAAREVYGRLHHRQQAYYIKRERVTVSGENRKRLPSRAYLNKISEMWWIDQGARLPLNPGNASELYLYPTNGAGRPVAQLIEENDVILLPDGGVYSGQIEFVYPFRPSDLVELSAARVISALGPGPLEVTLSAAAPSSWGVSVTVDVHSSIQGHEVKKWDAPVVVAGTSITFPDAIDGSIFGQRALAVGDYVCKASECAILPFPIDLVPELIAQATVKIAASLGHNSALQVHGARLGSIARTNVESLKKREDRRPMKITGRRGFL